MEAQLNPSVPGRTISNIPTNPMAIAVQRRQPTVSLNKTALASVTASGNICKSAVTLANGMASNADKKKYAAVASAPPRAKTIPQSRPERRRFRPLKYHAIAKSALDASTPRNTSSCDSGKAPPVALIAASPKVKAAIDRHIRIAPRVLSDNAFMTAAYHPLPQPTMPIPASQLSLASHGVACIAVRWRSDPPE